MTTIYLIRHATYADPSGMLPGRSPGYPLSDKGRKEAKLLADYFVTKHVAAIISSPLERTMETAQIIAGALHLPVMKDDRLLEVRSPFEGSTMASVDALGPKVYSQKYYDLGMEPLEDQFRRMDECIRGAVQRYTGREVILVSHGDPIMTIFMRYTGVRVLDKQRFIDETYVQMGGGIRITFDEKGVQSLTKFSPMVH